ncbi:hypothetical protein KIH39_08000 [Telmatocola sphagniphila]|uniref:IS66 family insertion sequence element accessory protein TnpB n=1 Tax=Telmatocola sphagniphila TaxID=1123043 RepID=A0A8E6B8I8_9BACT|nr:hypothetical protein [Telmatocola sphagniphila]QVL33837.1 hypothetical protein KIH39_08000 [Telmatocola sphagniphila]
MAKPHLRDPQREQLWRATFQSWQSSGLSVRAFCELRGLTESAFYFWRKELRKREAEAQPAFVPVTVVPVPAAATIEVRCPSGHIVTVHSVEESTFRALFGALSAQEASC